MQEAGRNAGLLHSGGDERSFVSPILKAHAARVYLERTFP